MPIAFRIQNLGVLNQNPTLARSTSCLFTTGPKIGIVHILGGLGEKAAAAQCLPPSKTGAAASDDLTCEQSPKASCRKRIYKPCF